MRRSSCSLAPVVLKPLISKCRLREFKSAFMRPGIIARALGVVASFINLAP